MRDERRRAQDPAAHAKKGNTKSRATLLARKKKKESKY